MTADNAALPTKPQTLRYTQFCENLMPVFKHYYFIGQRIAGVNVASLIYQLYCTFAAEFDSERIMKVTQHLMNLSTYETRLAYFYGSPCILYIGLNVSPPLFAFLLLVDPLLVFAVFCLIFNFFRARLNRLPVKFPASYTIPY